MTDTPNQTAVSDAQTDFLESDIDNWVAQEVANNPAAVPDFWDDCDTSGRLAEYLVRVGWRKLRPTPRTKRPMPRSRVADPDQAGAERKNAARNDPSGVG